MASFRGLLIWLTKTVFYPPTLIGFFAYFVLDTGVACLLPLEDSLAHFISARPAAQSSQAHHTMNINPRECMGESR